MNSLVFGLGAALAWGIHDVCIRYVSQRIDILAALQVVLGCGLVLMLPLALPEWSELSPRTITIAGAAGASFAGGSYALYRAFAIGPLRLVAPIVGAYPILSLLWAGVSGTPPRPLEWLAVLAIVGGVGLIAILSDEAGDGGGSRKAAILWAVLGGSGFALTFAIGQEASRGGAELSAVFVTRAAAFACVAAAILLRRKLMPQPRPALAAPMPWLLLGGMGCLDAVALGLVISAGSLPHPEFAAVAASVFGMVAILLAWIFLREPMTAPQWGGVLVVFAGIGYLAL